MDSHSNDSSSDSDSSPIRDKTAPNQSDSGSQEEIAYSIISPSKPLSALNVTRLSKEKMMRTTSISSTNSESLINFPGKRAPVREIHNFQELDQRDSEGPVESKRITRSSRRGEGGPTQNPANKAAKINKAKKLVRKSNRKLRSKTSFHQSELRESEYSSEGEDTSPLPPLVLMVSIPIENSSVNGEDSPAQSDAGSELSEPTETSNLALHHNKGKEIGNLDEEYDSKDSVDNVSSSERSNSNMSSHEDSGGEERSKEVPQSSEVTSGDQEDAWKHQTSSRSGEESLAESSNEEPAVSYKTPVSKRRAESNKAADNSGKSIPNRMRRAGNKEQHRSPDPTPTVKTTNKRALKSSKTGFSKEEEIRKKIKHVIQLDQEMDPTQLATILLESYHTLRNRDQQAIFCSPVTDDIAPGYSKLITQPMDFSRMKDKIDTEGYTRVEQLFDDFLLMCQNAMLYNKPTTYYYRAAKRIKEAGIKNLEKLARSYILSQKSSAVSSLQEQTRPPISKTKGLIVSIDRSSLSVPFVPSKPSLLSPNKSIQENESDLQLQTVAATNSLADIECTKSKLIESTVENTLSSLETDNPGQSQSGMDTDAVNVDTSLLPPPSSYTQSHSQVSARSQPNVIDKVMDSNINTRDISTSKKQPTLMEVKQRKFNKKREQSFQKMYTRASQARRIYGGSLAPVRPLSYGSFASFAPNYDSSFANINCQETDRVYSIVDQRELKECEDSMLYTSCDNEVSPYYLRLADGILSLDRDKSADDTSSWLRRTDRNSAFSQERMNILRQQAYQGEMRRRMECSFEAGLSGRMLQQLEEMLQQSAELISSLNQKQGREDDQEQGAGEELNTINKILTTIGAAIKTNESP